MGEATVGAGDREEAAALVQTDCWGLGPITGSAEGRAGLERQRLQLGRSRLNSHCREHRASINIREATGRSHVLSFDCIKPCAGHLIKTNLYNPQNNSVGWILK